MPEFPCQTAIEGDSTVAGRQVRAQLIASVFTTVVEERVAVSCLTASGNGSVSSWMLSSCFCGSATSV
ncbi:hypothetical protein XELAEV_18001702mg [Xenopus laevis]|nr:hypothetical protein XELAEV_18001702mg [Xenopus laevis]